DARVVQSLSLQLEGARAQLHGAVVVEGRHEGRLEVGVVVQGAVVDEGARADDLGVVADEQRARVDEGGGGLDVDVGVGGTPAGAGALLDAQHVTTRYGQPVLAATGCDGEA